ncbi:MFS transporter [Saccharolobus solfataricus]|uniref:MFS transporter n=2 Tax=Saccharolobus solfataricus TaxID=2287 RepID=A0A0E3MDW4_SACSO|nr:MFS transporter [Saccharolobus solfataricus]AKA74340.1 MFS transporter [Saccharolobus solfataricus]AKA77036.1 MFS transporter [Saccharolobus solfataricus]AKA79728.1 MFS transporter [Saccharolobus solfataricus]AZF68823.1 MFS transporter [Saccharolobus solfataricus]AZF71443.1 MFS transporter [Saccharolobus solfataricus]
MKILTGSIILTISQWYAFFLFSQLSFIEFNVIIGSVIFVLGFMARTLGSIVFGYIGDRVNRRTALILTGITLTISSLIILIPNVYSLIISRLLQGLSLGGEWGGASTIVIEAYSEHKFRGFITSLLQLSVPIGIIFSSLTILVVYYYSIYWPYSFISITFLSLFSLLLVKDVSTHNVSKSKTQPLLEAIRQDWKNILKPIGIKVSESANFYIFTSYIFTKSSSISFLSLIVLISISFQLFLIPLFGYLSDLLGRRKVILIGLILMTLAGIVLTRNLLPGEILMSVSDSALYAPQSSIFTEIFDKRYRFTASNFSYQLASILGGSVAPVILRANQSSLLPVTLSYVLITFISVLLITETKGKKI